MRTPPRIAKKQKSTFPPQKPLRETTCMFLDRFAPDLIFCMP